MGTISRLDAAVAQLDELLITLAEDVDDLTREGSKEVDAYRQAATKVIESKTALKALKKTSSLRGGTASLTGDGAEKLLSGKK